MASYAYTCGYKCNFQRFGSFWGARNLIGVGTAVPKEIVIDVDIAKVLNNNVKPKTIRWEGPHKLEVGLEIDKKIYEIFDQDPLAYAKIRDPISDRYKEFVSKAERLYQAADVGVKANKGKPKDIKKVLDTFNKGMDLELKSLNKDVPTIADAEWAKIKKTNKQYSSYKLRSFLKTLLNIVGVVLSAIGLGSAIATGGLTALIGLHGMASSLRNLYSDIKGLMEKAEKVRKALEEDVKSLKKSYAKKSGTEKGLTEVGKAAVQRILGKEFNSISNCRKNLRTFLDKLAGVDVAAHSLAKQLQVLLKQVDKARKENGDIISANPELSRKMDKLEKEIDGLINKIIRKQDEVGSGKKWSVTTGDELELIESGRPGWTKALERGLVVYDLVMSANDFENSVTGIIELTSSIASTAQDIEDEYKSLRK